MSRFARTGYGLFALGTGVWVYVTAQAPDIRTDPLRFAEQFLRATIQLNPVPPVFSVMSNLMTGQTPWTMRHFDVMLTSIVDAPYDERFVRLHAVFDVQTSSNEWYVSIWGPAVGQNRIDGLAELVQTNRSWTEADIEREMKRRNLKTTADVDDVLRKLPLANWRPLFGDLTVKEWQLRRVPAGDDPIGTLSYCPYWEIVLDGKSPLQRYFVALEPFEQRVINFALAGQDFKLKRAR